MTTMLMIDDIDPIMQMIFKSTEPPIDIGYIKLYTHGDVIDIECPKNLIGVVRAKSREYVSMIDRRASFVGEISTRMKSVEVVVFGTYTNFTHKKVHWDSGVEHVTVMRDRNLNVISWKSSSSHAGEVGQKLTVDFTPVRHYQKADGGKTTYVNRLKVCK